MKKIIKYIKQIIKYYIKFIDRRIYINPILKTIITNQFHKLYYDSYEIGKTWLNTYWFGSIVMKCPFDLWVYQEIIYEIKPDLIIECGTAHGGSALYLASLCELLNKGKVLTIDIHNESKKPLHKRIRYLHGSSISNVIIKKVKQLSKSSKNVLVILDSDHHQEHVLQELKLYSQFVTKGNYLIVEDSNINGHPIFNKFGPGPKEAINEFLKKTDDFEVDHSREKFYLTFNPGGFLKKIK